MPTSRWGFRTSDAGHGRRQHGGMTNEGVVSRIAQWSIRRPWWAIGLWLAFVAAAVALGGTMEIRQATGSDVSVGESGRAERIVEAAELTDPFAENVLITYNAGDEGAAHAAAEDATERMHALPHVAGVGEPVPSEHRDALLLPMTLAGDRDDGVDQVEPVLAEVTSLDRDHPDVRVEVVGEASIAHGINEVVDEDLASAGLLSVPVTVAVLFVVFGALLAAGVPLLLGFSAVAAATGLWAFASQVVPDIGTVPQLILLFGLAVGVDYSLFYLKREREERARGHGTVDAVAIAAATSGRAVVVSALTSIVALAGLYLAGDAIFRALGTGVILVVAVAMIGSLTVLPAMLAKLGRATDRPRVPLLWRLTRPPGPGVEPRVWRTLLAPALRAPRTTLVVTLVALAALALPALGMSLKNSTADDLPRTIPVMQAYDRMVDAFPSEGIAHLVVVSAPASETNAVRTALAELHQRAQDDPLFAVGPQPSIRTSTDGTVSTMVVGIAYDSQAPEAEESLSVLRNDLVPEVLRPVTGVEHAVGGAAAENFDYANQQSQRLPLVIGFVLLLTMATMTFAFRSVVVAAVAGALSMVSVGAAFGVLTLVFQNTWAEGLLGFSSTGHLVDWVPLFLFVVLFGLSMDYHVFTVSRIREAVQAGWDTRQAVRIGIGRSAGVVTSAAAVMVAVFSIFATLSLIEMKQLGVGLAAAIAIDAVIVRLLVLPSAMTLLGRANWWPSRPGLTEAGGSPLLGVKALRGAPTVHGNHGAGDEAGVV